MSDSEVPSYSGDASATPVTPGASPAMAGLIVPGPSWQEQDGILRDLWLQNKTPQEISDVLGRSIAAIMTRAARLGLPRRAAPGRKPGSRRMAGPADQAGQARAAPPRTVSRLMREGAEAGPQPSARICLMCLRSFQSMGRHNRICSSCKNSSEYESAASTADIHLPI